MFLYLSSIVSVKFHFRLDTKAEVDIKMCGFHLLAPNEVTDLLIFRLLNSTFVGLIALTKDVFLYPVHACKCNESQYRRIR